MTISASGLKSVWRVSDCQHDFNYSIMPCAALNNEH